LRQLTNHISDIAKRIDDLDKQIEEAFTSMREHPYRLHAVFIHRGRTAGGHYWIFIYDHQNEQWRKYDDETVSKVYNRHDIFSPIPNAQWNMYGAEPTPYFVAYVKADRATELTESVKRNVVYPPQGQPPPVPPRNQMSAMPPGGTQDVEMQETSHAGGNRGESSNQDFGFEPLPEKIGNWDDREHKLTGPNRW